MQVHRHRQRDRSYYRHAAPPRLHHLPEERPHSDSESDVANENSRLHLRAQRQRHLPQLLHQGRRLLGTWRNAGRQGRRREGALGTSTRSSEERRLGSHTGRHLHTLHRQPQEDLHGSATDPGTCSTTRLPLVLRTNWDRQELNCETREPGLLPQRYKQVVGRIHWSGVRHHRRMEPAGARTREADGPLPEAMGRSSPVPSRNEGRNENDPPTENNSNEQLLPGGLLPRPEPTGPAQETLQDPPLQPMATEE